MSKKSKINNPSASISINGNQKSSVKNTKNGAKVTYNMDPYEQAAYQYAQQSFAENLPNVNVFSDETIKNLNKQIEAYKNQGLTTINETYTPMIRDMQNDIAKRFGNIDNSVFMDNLSDLETKRAYAMSDFAQDVSAKQQELMNEELASRYAYLAMLSDYQNSVYNNMLNTLSTNQGFLNSNQNYQNALANKNSGSNNMLNYIQLATKFLV